ncbi:MAG: 4-hydroxy-3-methylbut-2-enyl diphosphate reductase [Lachnospiraceae bacterium]|nr:4-hydroxy-3-methylbut-2-enyl diphosphate reductase [Lachnospiraceae bacterium]
MKVELAEKAGFCFGVNRAVDTVYREASSGGQPVYTFGPIIHNEEVIADLEKKGVKMIGSLDQARALGGGTIVIRSHGVPKAVQDALADAGLNVVDATCPFVKKIHNIVHEYSGKGYFILIVGSADHPEVEGIVGWARPDGCKVVATEKEAAALNLRGRDKICVVAQTTFNHKKFQDIVEILRKVEYDDMSTAKDGSDFLVHNTICSATKERQDAAAILSRRADAMIVIGGASSSNTRKLCEICSENCRNTYFIQTKEDLEHSDFSRFGYVGITAGASTPNNIIEEVQEYVRNEL